MIWALHGAFGAASDWDPLQERGMNLRAVDLWEGVRAFEPWVTGFHGRVQREDEAPSVMGYSLGGRLALHALVAKPEFWKSAIIVSAHPGLEDEAERKARRERDAEWARRVREELPEMLEHWEAQEILGGVEKEYDIEELEVNRDAVAASFEKWSLGRQEPFWDRLGMVACPLLWVTGERDTKYTALAARVTASMPGARHVVAGGCGHRVPWEDADWFAREVLRFQNEVAIA